MSNQSNASKRTSIMDMFSEGPASEELYNLKEFLDLLRQEFDLKLDDTERLVKRKNLDIKLDDEYINANVKKIFEICLDRVSSNSSTQLASRKTDLAIKILDTLALYSNQIDGFDLVIPNIIKILDKTFFDKATKLFQTTDPEFALKLVKIIIETLGKSLHNNLSIINPLLQIMEFAFKHSNNQIKAQSYDCWLSLIRNFAIDRDFFLKPKKFSLILMPLLNKCKTFKDENVSKAKVLAWMCLIENLGDQISKYTSKVLIPFFSYCFGLNGLMIENGLLNEENEDSSNDEKVKKILSIKLQSEHEFKPLIQIGSEVLISIIFDGNLSEQNEEFQKKLLNINTKLNYGVQELINDRITWTFIMKYFFDILMTQKSYQTNDGILLVETWKQMAKLLYLDIKIEQDEDEEMIMESQFKSLNRPEITSEYLKDFKIFFLSNSVDFVNNFTLSPKNLDNKFIAQMAKLILSNVKNEYEQYYAGRSEMKVNLIKLIKKCSNLILVTDEEDTNVFFSNLGFLFSLMEKNNEFIDLYLWIHLTTKFYDYLKSIKTKTNLINMNQQNYNLVTESIMFPFKYYKNLDILESDIKLILSSCSNIAKLFSSLIKQNRIKIENSDDLTINNWCSLFYVNLLKQFKKSSDSNLIYDLNKYWFDLYESINHPNSQANQLPTSYLIDNTLKILQLQTQFVLTLLQNVYEFDALNELSNSQSNEPLGVFSSTRRNCSNFPSDLIDFMRQGINLFHKFIKTQYNQTSLKLNEEDIDNENLKKEQNFEITDGKSEKDNKLPVQIFICLIEQLSCLFTRIKSNYVLNNLLISFSECIKNLSELNSISKQTVNDSTPKTPTHSNLNSHFKYSSEKTSIQFHSNRKSSDLFDTFSLQISSLIQNTVAKTYSTHDFDSALLEKFEPIFYSFLTYTTKAALKQKTLQAWNATFGKSTVQSLKYPKRLEELFVEIKEEMIQKKTSNNLVLSLPGFKPLDLFNSNTNNTTNSTFMVQEPEMNDEKENTPENLKTESNSSIGIAHFVFSPAAGKNSFFKQQSASASKVVHTPENKTLRPRPSPRSLNHNSKRKLDLNGLIDQQPDKDFVAINKSELKSRRSLTLRSKQPLTEHQKEVRKTRSFIPMELQPVDADSQMSCSIMDEDTTTQTVEIVAEKMTDESAKAIFQFKSLKEKSPEKPTEPETFSLKFHSKINPRKEIEVIEVKKDEEKESEESEESKRRSERLKHKDEIIDQEVEKLGESLIDKLENQIVRRKKTNIEMLKIKNSLLKKSKKMVGFKPKSFKVAKKKLEKYKNLIVKSAATDESTKKSEKTKKKLEKRKKIEELNASLNEEEQEVVVVNKPEIEETKDVSMQVVDADSDIDDDQPLSSLIDKKKVETPELEIKKEEIPVTQTPLSETPGSKLEPVIEDEVTESSKPTKKTTEDLIHRLNNTPTTSILKKRISKIMNQSETLLIDNDTPGKRRVSFCESVQVEEIEPNFNKSIFNRSTPRTQNKAKIVLSPYFGNKNGMNNSPVVASPAVTNTTNQIEAQKNPVNQPVPTTPNSKTLQTPPNVQNSPGSASFLDFFSNNRIMSQRSSIIQAQMQSKSESPVVQNKLIGLSNSLPLASPNLESPRPINKTISQMEGLNDFKISEKLKISKLSIEILFDQVNTSLYMQKLGSYKYFKYKNILTMGDFCSLMPNEINNLPLKCPKYDNYLGLIKNFEEKCSDMLNKEEKKVTTMGSVEEEMEKLEKMEGLNVNLDTSIECVNDKPKMDVDEIKKEDSKKIDLSENLMTLMQTFESEVGNFNEMVKNGELSIGELFDLSRQMDLNRLKITQIFNTGQEMIRNLIESKATKL